MIERFYQHLVMWIFPHQPWPGEIQEFLKTIKDNFFESLGGGESKLVKLEELVSTNFRDLDNMQFVIHGDYSGHGTTYTLVLDRKLNVKNLFVK